MATTAPRPRRHAANRAAVLYVDDQQGNLTAFKASLRRYADITTATSGKKGLELLAQQEFPVIISDQRMDEMEGSEFLALAREIHPDSVRILLTAHTDFDGLADAINNGQISRLIQKPWGREEMIAIIDNAAALWRKSRETRLLSRHLVAIDRQATVGRAAAAMFQGLDQSLEGNYEMAAAAAARSRPLLQELGQWSRDPIGDQPVRVYTDVAALASRAAHLAVIASERRRFAGVIAQTSPMYATVDPGETLQLLIHLMERACDLASDGHAMVFLEQEEDALRIIVSPSSDLDEPEVEHDRLAEMNPSLVVARRIAARHHGSFAVEEQDGVATYIVTLPHPTPVAVPES